MNKENVNVINIKNVNKPSESDRILRLNKQIRSTENKIKALEERSTSNGIIAEIKEIYELISTQDNFIEFLLKSTKAHPRSEEINGNIQEMLKKALSREKEIGKDLIRRSESDS
jgi:hypothetical protein